MVDPVSRTPGVGSVQLFGDKYAMRIWLDPEQAQYLRPDAVDVIGAMQGQNALVSAGQLGAAPYVPGQQLNATVTALGRLQTPEQFGNIVLRSNTDGSTPAPARRGARRARAGHLWLRRAIQRQGRHGHGRHAGARRQRAAHRRQRARAA